MRPWKSCQARRQEADNEGFQSREWCHEWWWMEWILMNEINDAECCWIKWMKYILMNEMNLDEWNKSWWTCFFQISYLGLFNEIGIRVAFKLENNINTGFMKEKSHLNANWTIRAARCTLMLQMLHITKERFLLLQSDPFFQAKI